MLGVLRTIDPAYALTLALLSSAIGYRFASGNQLEQLPIILRHIDPGYLARDVFVSSAVEFGPRFYFAQFVGLLCQLMPLHWVYALLRFVSDLALIVVTMWAAVRVLGSDRLGAMIAAVLAIAVSSIHLGDATELRYFVFQPASLAIPGALFALGLGLRGRPVAAALAASLSSIPHPLYGVYGGAIGLLTGCVALIATQGERGLGAALRAAVLWTAMGGAIFGASLVAFWWWPAQTVASAPLTTAELFDILARFRSPHHYLPSHFRPEDYVILGVFLWAGWLAFDEWRRDVPARRAGLLLLPVAGVFIACVTGVLLTEVWEVRAVLTLQPFRLLGILKWIGFLLFGWVLAAYWQRPPNDLARPAVVTSLLAAGGAHPLVTAAGLSLVRWESRLPGGRTRKVWTVLLVVVAVAVAITFGSFNERARLFAAVGFLAGFAHPRTTVRAATTAAALLAVLVVALNRPEVAASSVTPVRPVFTWDDLRDVDAETARAAASQSPPDAIFVAPPQFGILRVVGQRALVVDFEAIPFQGDHMRAWRERIRDVYGEVEGGGHAARAALEHRYRSITDARLQALAERYGATHAVLYAETPTALPVLHVNATYRVVRVR